MSLLEDRILADEQGASATMHLQSGISSSFDMSTKGPRGLDRDLLPHLGKTYSRGEADTRDGYDFACTQCQSVDELYTLK